MNCMAIDDEPMALEVMEDYIKKVPWLIGTKNFRNALKALEYMQEHSVDLLFLDIHMPDISGLQLLRAIPNPPMVIFTTAYPNYALESYDLEAIDYLLKPIRFERFLKATHKAQEKYHSRMLAKMPFTRREMDKIRSETLFIKSGTQIYPVSMDDILYLEGAGNYINYYLREKKIMALQTMSEAYKTLSSQHFMRVHRSYIISKSHIDLIERHQIKIANKWIPIGKQYREEFFMWIGNDSDS